MQCVELAIQYKLKAVSYGRGPDKATIARLKTAGVLCIPTVGAVKHAIKAVSRYKVVKAVVIQVVCQPQFYYHKY